MELCKWLCCCCYYESLSCWALYKTLHWVQICITSKVCTWSKEGLPLFTVDAVRRYFQKYHLQQTYHFRTIPADKRIAPAVVHCVKGHLYSAAGEVLWLYSIALAEELCVKGHSCTHIHLCTQDCSWQEPQQVAFWVWRTDWVNPGQRDCKLCSGIISEWCPRDMLYDSSVSEQKRSEELELLRSTLSGIDESYSWRQVKELLQERVFPQCEKFGTWSSDRERADWVPNRKVLQQKGESSVLGPQSSSVSRPSPEFLNRKVQTLSHPTVSVLGPQRDKGESRPSPE